MDTAERVLLEDALISLAERAGRVDRAVTEAAEGLLFPAIPAGLALVAVGGYGRRQLFPHSDVDLLLLAAGDGVGGEQQQAISEFLQRLWDGGMRVSQQVRTPEECLEVHDRNAELNISLLDQRFLAGDRALYAGMGQKFPRFVESHREELMRNLARLTRERHAKYAATFYHLEPNVKETPGGLRDYQFVHWMEQLREANGARMAQPEAPAELQQAFRFLARLRWFLHRQAGRDNNLLTFEAQDAMGGSDAAAWMREYYRQARAVYRAAAGRLENAGAQSSGLFAQFRDWRSRLSNGDFAVHRERVHFRSQHEMEQRPELVLEMFEFAGRHELKPSAEAAQQMEARLKGLREYFKEPRALWEALQRIFSTEHAPAAVRWMHETGVLTALFPELEGMECLVVRDFYHRYTVDEHTLVALTNLWKAEGGYGDLLREVEQPALLLFALLFHDAGKGRPGGAEAEESHVAWSLRLAEEAMRRVKMPETDRDTVRFLIGHHLELSAAMRGRDLADPRSMEEVAHQVGTVERLKALTLVTYADITAMTAWRAEQLWRLYLKVHHELTRELETERIAGAPVELLDGFPMRYLRTHTEEQIAEHVALEERSRGRGLAVEIRRRESTWQLTAMAQDRMGLFAVLAGTLAGFGMNILRAEAFSNRRGLVLDTLVFEDPNRTLELNPTEVDRLRVTVERALGGKLDVRDLLRNRPKPPSRKQRVGTRVRFDGEAGSSATLVEIVAADRPGLLYDLASAISAQGGNIEVVLTDTRAHQAIDVFYVTVGGRKLTGEQEAAMGEALRRACGE
ncbi:MAG: HD domain-containing protein [Bryobacteraceae bacterium]